MADDRTDSEVLEDVEVAAAEAFEASAENTTKLVEGTLGLLREVGGNRTVAWALGTTQIGQKFNLNPEDSNQVGLVQILSTTLVMLAEQKLTVADLDPSGAGI